MDRLKEIREKYQPNLLVADSDIDAMIKNNNEVIAEIQQATYQLGREEILDTLLERAIEINKETKKYDLSDLRYSIGILKAELKEKK